MTAQSPFHGYSSGSEENVHLWRNLFLSVLPRNMRMEEGSVAEKMEKAGGLPGCGIFSCCRAALS